MSGTSDTEGEDGFLESDGFLENVDAVFELVGGGMKNALRCGR